MKSFYRISDGILVVTIGFFLSQDAIAHEGHAALPSTGVVRDGNQLLISPPAIKAIGMRTKTISLGDIQHTLRVNARVELPWSNRAKVSSLTDGKIAQVLVQPGEIVKAGQVLAWVESLELESLQVKLLQSHAAIDLLNRQIVVRENIAKQIGATQDNKLLLKTKAERLQKQAQYAIAFQKLLSLGLTNRKVLQIRNTGQTVSIVPIVAPISGTIQSVLARRGQLVQATDYLFEIVDFSTLYVVGEVLEGDAYQIQKGLETSISFSGFGDTPLRGRIDHVRLKMDEKKRSIHVVVAVDNDNGNLRPGMFASMDIQVARAMKEIVCPTSALIESEKIVYVLKREAVGKFSRTPVTIGMRSPTQVVIKTGLFPGQQVITRGSHLLAAMFDGDPSKGTAGKNLKKRSKKSPRQTRIVAPKATVRLPNNSKAYATSLIEGRVTRLFVKPGAVVKSGDVLAEIESQQLRDLQLELLQTLGTLQWTRSEVDRLNRLVSSGGVSVNEIQQRVMEVKSLEFQAGSQKRRLSLIGLSAEQIVQIEAGKPNRDNHNSSITGRLAIRSPIRGRVADMGLAIGEIVHAHDILFEIQDTSTVWIEALLLEKDAPRVRASQIAVITFPSHPNLRISGKVLRLAPQLTSRDRVLPIWIEIPNPEGFLKEGMYARTIILVPEKSVAGSSKSSATG